MQGRQRSGLSLGHKRAALGLKAAVESAPAATREKKAGRGVLKARPIGVGHAAPEVSISNSDMEKIVETTGEWIQTRTGIENRHVLKGKETLRDLAIKAGKVLHRPVCGRLGCQPASHVTSKLCCYYELLLHRATACYHHIMFTTRGCFDELQV